MPRALTEQEKCRQCQRLIENGKSVVFSLGIRNVSVDDITRAAGMSKGSFYQHFESKEKYLYALIEHIHRQAFSQAEQILLGGNDLQANARDLLKNLLHMPEMAFFVQHEQDINELFFNIMQDGERQSFKQLETSLFEGLLRMGGVDTTKVNPGVVHNFVHMLYLIMGNDLMTAEALPETADLITDSLISYIFGGTG